MRYFQVEFAIEMLFVKARRLEWDVYDMSKTLPATIGALALGLGFGMFGLTTSASAHHGGYYPGCHCGGGTSYKVRTVHPVSNVFHHHDRSVYNHVTKYHRVVTITRIQPIIKVHNSTTIHHHTIVSVRDVYASKTEHLHPIVYTTSSVHSTYDCHCGH